MIIDGQHMGGRMPLDPQFRTVLDTFEAKGLVPLVRGDAATTRAHYQQLTQARRGPDYVPEQVASVADRRSPGGVRSGSTSRGSRVVAR
jgi:hypothetical protein